MSTDRLDQMARALRALPDRLTATVGEVVAANGHVLEDANTAQLAEGLDSQGQPIRPVYAALTVELKEAKGQPTDRVTLRDSGDYYSSIVARVRGQAVELDATDPKAEGLALKYGADIVGLSEQAVDEFREDYVRPELENETRRALGL